MVSYAEYVWIPPIPAPSEKRTDRELLNELGVAIGRIEGKLQHIEAKLDALQAKKLVKDFKRNISKDKKKKK